MCDVILFDWILLFNSIRCVTKRFFDFIFLLGWLLDRARSNLLTLDVVSGLLNMMSKLLSVLVDGFGLRFFVGCIIIILLFFGSFILLLMIIVLIIEVLLFLIIILIHFFLDISLGGGFDPIGMLLCFLLCKKSSKIKVNFSLVKILDETAIGNISW